MIRYFKSYKIHNYIGHPMMQLCKDLGLNDMAEWWHMYTLPEDVDDE